MNFKSVVLCILDGWGNGIENSRYNAISSADPPCWKYISSNYPRCNLSACGVDVGLPDDQVGSSEVGHMNIGSGRIIMQNLQRINQEIETIENNVNLQNFINVLKGSGGVCHILGLVSNGGVHSHQKHILFLANKISQYGIRVMIHAFLDGRDTLPNSGKKCIYEFEKGIKGNDNIKIATISGRYYAMDRDNRWERTIKAYKAIAFANAPYYRSATSLIDNSYQNSITDEFIKPAIICNYHGMKREDGVLLANFRADRMLQLTNILLGKTNYTKIVKLSSILSMVQYNEHLKIPYLFPPISLTNTLGCVVSDNKLRQLRIAETEKYAHVTFFFNCGKEEPFPREERILIPSPKIKTYDLCPEMSAFKITEKLIEKIFSQEFALIVVNYANADMVGHTGNIRAAQKAVLIVDICLARILNVIKKVGNTVLSITADHGNIEYIFDEKNNTPHTSHTLNAVPFVLYSSSYNNFKLRNGKLSDIAPTILQLLGIEKPNEMTGNSLLV
ncbi:MAG: 2,3-bisphosphoglycerate-independent phosphoglycerate mutase [Wolbachia endosymbiont of Menacanthus eurysternus]|nr:MAG: 2,3-bisphosphoglycerate-independent phosphoglycerate mutase [Wolbachia endosymbiont of Menacanthus eurysternus]